MLLLTFTSEAQPVTKIAGGLFHSLFLKSDGSLWAMGNDAYGQLGDGTYGSIFSGINLPEEIVASNVTAIAGGEYHTLFLKNDGSLWAMGDDKFGELGDGVSNTPSLTGPNASTNLPEQIVASNVTAIAAGAYFSLFLKSDGSLWGMGDNYQGQLGDGTYNYTNQPEMIVASNVTAVATEGSTSLFLKCDGSLWAMGLNNLGQLGDGTFNNTNRPEMIVASNVTVIAAGDAHSLFLKSDGSLWAMGDNDGGQLGDGTYNNADLPEQIVASNVTAIAGGGAHTLFLKSDGSLWAMGLNDRGQLGGGNYSNVYPYDSTNLPEEIVASNVTAIAAGDGQSLFLRSDGSLWAMGDNYFGELGDGTYNNTNRPELIVASPPGYNQISIQLLSGGNVSLSFVGMTGTNYALDWTTSLAPPNWVPQLTNPAGVGGVLVFTNTPDATTNNFWRIRSVP